jgi:hypothetical protein
LGDGSMIDGGGMGSMIDDEGLGASGKGVVHFDVMRCAMEGQAFRCQHVLSFSWPNTSVCCDGLLRYGSPEHAGGVRSTHGPPDTHRGKRRNSAVQNPLLPVGPPSVI